MCVVDCCPQTDTARKLQAQNDDYKTQLLEQTVLHNCVPTPDLALILYRVLISIDVL